jgi:SAM-dependent methyltransferase
MNIEGPVPIPPIELRRMVGLTNVETFDNPSGELLFSLRRQSRVTPEIPVDAYDAVFDFGCGCGRVARQLLQQKPRPRRYVGIDVHRGMIAWCTQNLSPIDRNFHFRHHDVYSPTYAAENSYRLAEPFPVNDEEFSLLIAGSVFTHLFQQQAAYYLYEVARILRPQGIAFTTWFFFDKESFPFLRPGPYCLYASLDPTAAVIYDRRWFIDTVRRSGLCVRLTIRPQVAGHQWEVLLGKRTPKAVDQFPLGEEGAEWLCGATQKRIAEPTISQADRERFKIESVGFSIDSEGTTARPEPLALVGPLAELAAMKRSWTWRIGRVITRPLGVIKRTLFRK